MMESFEPPQYKKDNKSIIAKLDRNQYKQSLQQSSVHPSEVSIPRQNAPIDMFFKRKQEQINKKQSHFSKVLDSKQFQILSNENNFSKSISKFSRFSKSSIKKKQEEKEAQLKSIIDEHKKMLNKLQSKVKSQEELNQFEKNLLKQQKSRYLQKIEELQCEIELLYRDNYRLKEVQKTQPINSFEMSSLNQKSLDGKGYQPYTLNTKKNDLNKIMQKNLKKTKEKEQDILGSKLQREKPLTADNFFNKRPNNHGLFHQKFPKEAKEDNYILKDLLGSSFDDNKHSKNKSNLPIPNQRLNSSNQMNQVNSSMQSINRGSHFDTFQIANSLSYINDSAINESRRLVKMSKQNSTRNKVAFFKNSLVLIKQEQFQIAFKRSDLNEKMDKLRLIFYVNNKSNLAKSFNFNYEYQEEYFKISIIQKLSIIEGQKQGRQVLQITLISKDDLNGVSDVHVDVDGTIYDLWLPANFIKFKSTDKYRMLNDELQMVIVPDRQFANCKIASGVIPLIYGGRDRDEEWGYLYGESKFGNFTAKLTWHDKQLTIDATEKWIDFLGFLFHFFK